MPTIEVELKTKKGAFLSAVPIGTSRGRHETTFLPVEDAIRKFALISRQFRSEQFYNQEEVDATLHVIDKSSNFKEIGGNVALGISSAFLKAFALEAGLEVFEYVFTQVKQKKQNGITEQEAMKASNASIPIPMPICNMVGGWKSESGISQSDIQEFLLLPVYQKSFFESAKNLSEAYREIGKEFEKADNAFQYGKNIESAWITKLGVEEVLKILSRIGNQRMLKIGLDVAASNLWDGRNYVYRRNPEECKDYEDESKGERSERFLRSEQLDFLDYLARCYPIAYIEDPFEEEDFVSHSAMTQLLSNRSVMVCGDDLYATNLTRLQIGIGHKATNAALIKPNQIGTITDTIKFVEEAKKAGMKTVMSHRSGETEDTLICHLAVGLGCDYVKLGISGERTTKINEMIRIEEKLKF